MEEVALGRGKGDEGGGRWRQGSWREEGDEELDVQLDLGGAGGLCGGDCSLQGGLTGPRFPSKAICRGYCFCGALDAVQSCSRRERPTHTGEDFLLSSLQCESQPSALREIAAT